MVAIAQGEGKTVVAQVFSLFIPYVLWAVEIMEFSTCPGLQTCDRAGTHITNSLPLGEG